MFKGLVSLLIMLGIGALVVFETIMIINWFTYLAAHGTGMLTGIAGIDQASEITGTSPGISGSIDTYGSEISAVTAFYSGCNSWKIRGCSETENISTINIRNFDYDNDGIADTMADACSLSGYSKEECWKACCNPSGR